ncbi:hypothetical protein [Streptomyces sp. NPDC001581]|uniref:dioxygenase family protein n=1 Tax=unclassified Streptomyces TaxID=2593676 RepID=UPI00333309D9
MSNVTEGPYYLDGALVRKDIAEGKKGVPLTVRLTVQDTTESCAPVPGAAVEIWHCDAWGYYSGWTTGAAAGGAAGVVRSRMTVMVETCPRAAHSSTARRIDRRK